MTQPHRAVLVARLLSAGPRRHHWIRKQLHRDAAQTSDLLKRCRLLGIVTGANGWYTLTERGRSLLMAASMLEAAGLAIRHLSVMAEEGEPLDARVQARAAAGARSKAPSHGEALRDSLRDPYKKAVTPGTSSGA